MGDTIRLLRHPPAPGPRNMAVDEALMGAARRGEVVLRFYRWEPPCLSLGRNQAARDRYDRGLARERGIQFVRRPTGGRAVLHHRELTYAVTAPAERWGSLRESYRLINRALLRGLARLGTGAEAADRGPDAGTPGPSARACFRDPLPGEIVALGRKLVGSAQWRDGGALLQHGSILLHDDQGTADALRLGGPGEEDPSAREGGAVALDELLAEPPSPQRLAELLSRAFGRETGMTLRPSRLTAGEEARAGELEPRYARDDWTWRR